MPRFDDAIRNAILKAVERERSQAGLCKKTGISTSMMSRYANGNVETINAGTWSILFPQIKEFLPGDAAVEELREMEGAVRFDFVAWGRRVRVLVDAYLNLMFHAGDVAALLEVDYGKLEERSRHGREELYILAGDLLDIGAAIAKKAVFRRFCWSVFTPIQREVFRMLADPGYVGSFDCNEYSSDFQWNFSKRENTSRALVIEVSEANRRWIPLMIDELTKQGMRVGELVGCLRECRGLLRELSVMYPDHQVLPVLAETVDSVLKGA